MIHTINEPAAVGAYQALKAVGKENDVLIVSVDGGCPGVASVKEGVIGATSQQYPLLMAALGVEAIKKWADTGEKPAADPRQGLLRHRRGAGHRQARRRRRRRSTPPRARSCAGADRPAQGGIRVLIAVATEQGRPHGAALSRDVRAGPTGTSGRRQSGHRGET